MKHMCVLTSISHPNWNCTLLWQAADTDSKEALYLPLQPKPVIVIVETRCDARDKMPLSDQWC